MPKFNDLASLFAYVDKSINRALKENVAPVVEQTMQKKIQEKVYDSYTPEFYERRHELGNSANISSEIIEDGVLFTKNTAEPNKSVYPTPYYTTFPEWVNNGWVPNIFNDRTDYPWMNSRDFISASVEELQASGAVTDALAQGLKYGGANVKIAAKIPVKRGG